MMKPTVLLLLLPALALALVRHERTTTRWHQLEKTGYNFAKYQAEFGRKYAPEEVEMRSKIFATRLAAILKHNRGHSTWKAGVNHLTDRTDEELKALRGYSKEQALYTQANPHPLRQMYKRSSKALPQSVDWRLMGAVTPVKDQGACGSCWTFASAETIESFWYLAGNQMVELSEQQIASCSPNPQDCGGTGGCEGGTAEIAFAGVVGAGGIASEWVYPYVSHQGTDFPCTNGTSFAAKIKGYTKLPVNDYESLMDAVAHKGPIAISVDASAWSSYETGIFNSCNMASPTIDHAVQLVGYGQDKNGGLYWTVRNSWTPGWGEHGYIRVYRQGNPQVCGVDSDPGSGTGCSGGPPTQTVCGECGILSDSAFPTI